MRHTSLSSSWKWLSDMAKRRRLGARTAVAAPVVALILVALAQLWMAKTEGLTPWKGGGFGMFSSIDSGSNRLLRVRLLVDGKEYIVAPPKLPGGEMGVLKNFPTEQRLRRYAEFASGQAWMASRPPDVQGSLLEMLTAALAPTDGSGDDALADTLASSEIVTDAFLRATDRLPVAVMQTLTARPWRPTQGEPDRLLRVQTVRIEILRKRFHRATSELRLERVKYLEVAAPPLQEILSRLGVSRSVRAAVDETNGVTLKAMPVAFGGAR